MMLQSREQTTLLPIHKIQNQKKLLTNYDSWLMGVSLIILFLGLIVVASASVSIAAKDFGDPLYYFWRQSVSALLGLGCAFIALKMPIRVWELASVPLLIFAIFLLVLILVPGVGREVNGSVRWIKIGPLSFQPSEFIKLFVINYLAGYLVRHSGTVQNDFIGFMKPMGVMVLISSLLLLEPDFGACVVLFATALGMLFMGGVSLSRFIAWVFVAAGVLFSLAIFSSYRMERLMSFVDPWKDPYNSGFQLTQALISFGRGDWFGVGLGSSVQKLFYLPEAHTDFIFAVFSEELGLVASIILIALYCFIAWRSFRIGYAAEWIKKYYAAYFAYGIGLIICIQAYINLGVNMGMLPTKGLTLPLFSYGGNSLIVYCLLLGILLRIDYENKQYMQTLHSKRV